jgi:hypothetical protein
MAVGSAGGCAGTLEATGVLVATGGVVARGGVVAEVGAVVMASMGMFADGAHATTRRAASDPTRRRVMP